MFGAITVPFGVKLLFNTVKLKPGVTYDDVELALAEMCSVVKDTYGGDKGGFVAGQVFRYAGYATDPSYASKLIGLMDRYNLYRYDEV